VTGSRAATPDDPLHGLTPENQSLGRMLQATGFAYLDLPLETGRERDRVIQRGHRAASTLTHRLDAPVGGMTVQRDVEGGGPYFLLYLGHERPETGPRR
jgi:hypothetical protein